MFRLQVLLFGLVALGTVVSAFHNGRPHGRGRPPPRRFPPRQRQRNNGECIYESPDEVGCDITFMSRVMLLISGDSDYCEEIRTLPCFDTPGFLGGDPFAGQFQVPSIYSPTPARQSQPVPDMFSSLLGGIGTLGNFGSLVDLETESRVEPPRPRPLDRIAPRPDRRNLARPERPRQRQFQSPRLNRPPVPERGEPPRDTFSSPFDDEETADLFGGRRSESGLNRLVPKQESGPNRGPSDRLARMMLENPFPSPLFEQDTEDLRSDTERRPNNDMFATSRQQPRRFGRPPPLGVSQTRDTNRRTSDRGRQGGFQGSRFVSFESTKQEQRRNNFPTPVTSGNISPLVSNGGQITPPSIDIETRRTSNVKETKNDEETRLISNNKETTAVFSRAKTTLVSTDEDPRVVSNDEETTLVSNDDGTTLVSNDDGTILVSNDVEGKFDIGEDQDEIAELEGTNALADRNIVFSADMQDILMQAWKAAKRKKNEATDVPVSSKDFNFITGKMKNMGDEGNGEGDEEDDIEENDKNEENKVKENEEGETEEGGLEGTNVEAMNLDYASIQTMIIKALKAVKGIDTAETDVPVSNTNQIFNTNFWKNNGDRGEDSNDGSSDGSKEKDDDVDEDYEEEENNDGEKEEAGNKEEENKQEDRDGEVEEKDKEEEVEEGEEEENEEEEEENEEEEEEENEEEEEEENEEEEEAEEEEENVQEEEVEENKNEDEDTEEEGNEEEVEEEEGALKEQNTLMDDNDDEILLIVNRDPRRKMDSTVDKPIADNNQGEGDSSVVFNGFKKFWKF